MKKSAPFIIGIFLYFSFILLLIKGCSLISNLGFDYCIEDGYCKEGRILNTENGEIIINKQTCIKNNGDWFEDKKICRFK